MEDLSYTIVEVREEHMITPTGHGDPTLRIAHFLSPSISSIDGQVLEPLHFSYSSSLPPNFAPKLNLSFSVWQYPKKNWETWVACMVSLHESTWKQAGIYEAILNSTYRINRNDDLICGISERWCSTTNSFNFPWGEATITLEDMLVLGGYSVIGESVFRPLESEEKKNIKAKLCEARLELVRTNAKKATLSLWMKKFMNNQSDIEHEAFLVFWLSGYVFQSTRDTISKSIFPLAIHLARGILIALAPAVLASVYSDLTLFKEKISFFTDDCHETIDITLKSPFHLVQLWVWERFVALKPEPNLIENGQSRLSRWNNLITLTTYTIVKLALDSAGETFLWRPYVIAISNWEFPQFYYDKEVTLLGGSGSDEVLQTFATCIRVSELVGFDGIVKQYLPHRVAMQFGMDQDIPGSVIRFDETPHIAWNYYDRAFRNMPLYIPARLFESDVTVRYLKWWKSVLVEKESRKSYVPRQKENEANDNDNNTSNLPKDLKKTGESSKGKMKLS